MIWHVLYEDGQAHTLPKLSSRELNKYEESILAKGLSFIKIDKIRVYCIGQEQWLSKIAEVLNGKAKV
jgi:hypothetical protein